MTDEVTRSKNLALPIVILLVCLIYFLSYVRYGFPYDEGYLLDGVEKVMDGKLIYRDFHHTYAPGRFYLVSALFRVFGKSLIVERVLFAVLEAVKCLLALVIATRLTRHRVALLAPILVVIAPGPWHKVFFSTFGMFCIWLALDALHHRSSWRYLLLGLGIGVTFVMRQDIAGFVLVSALITDAVIHVKRHLKVVNLMKEGALVLAGVVVCVGPVLVYFHINDALGLMIHKIAVDGMLDNMTNRIAYPTLGISTRLDTSYLAFVLPAKILFYVPPIVYLLSAILVVTRIRRQWEEKDYSLLLVLIVAVLAFNQSIWRSDIGHLLQTMQYVFLLIPPLVLWARGLLRSLGTGRRFKSVLMSIIYGLAPGFFLWATLACAYSTENPLLRVRFLNEGIVVGDTRYIGSLVNIWGKHAPLETPRGKIYVRQGEASFFTALESFLQSHTKPGDYVLAIPHLQSIYFLFDRKNPTRYAHYRRALPQEEETQYINDIASHQPEYILLTEHPRGALSTRQRFDEYAGRVKRWIMEHYEFETRIGNVIILRRK